MCLIAFAYRAHPRYPLIVAANRDEFLDREADHAHYWPDEPRILAGRDRRALGTWLGITTEGRFAAITNHRDLRRAAVNGPSRGLLVREALVGAPLPDKEPLDGYNLLYGDLNGLRYRSNISGDDQPVQAGIHALSNALLDTPWPKVKRAKLLLTSLIGTGEPDTEALFGLLADSEQAFDSELPDTGLDIARERALSSIRIAMPGYGTRCSTVVLVDHDGRVRFEERTHETGKVVLERFML